jgi:uncharacterized lipoprotein YmbA
VEDFMDKLADLPLDQMLENFRKTLESVRKLVDSPDLHGTLAGARRATEGLAPSTDCARRGRRAADRHAGTRDPTDHLGGAETIRAARQGLDACTRRLGTVDDAEDGRGEVTAAQTVDELDRTLKACGNLVDYVQTHPEAVVLGSQGRREAMRRASAVLALAVLAAAPACVSLKRTPEARFFVLRTLAEPPAAESGGAPALVGLLPVALPGYLERPQLITWVAPGELRIDEYLRWAEPLDFGFARTLAANLDTLLPESRVIRSPWPAKARPQCRVRVELQRFGPQASTEVVLEGRYALLPADGERPIVTRPVSLKRGPLGAAAAGEGATAGVEAMSELVADLARDIAAAIRALPAGTDESG